MSSGYPKNLFIILHYIQYSISVESIIKGLGIEVPNKLEHTLKNLLGNSNDKTDSFDKLEIFERN